MARKKLTLDTWNDDLEARNRTVIEDGLEKLCVGIIEGQSPEAIAELVGKLRAFTSKNRCGKFIKQLSSDEAGRLILSCANDTGTINPTTSTALKLLLTDRVSLSSAAKKRLASSVSVSSEPAQTTADAED